MIHLLKIRILETDEPFFQKNQRQSVKILTETAMPGAGGHRFVFEKKVPPIIGVLYPLFFANMAAGFLSDNALKHLSPHAPGFLLWYLNHCWIIEAVLGLSILAVFIANRGQVRHIPPPVR